MGLRLVLVSTCHVYASAGRPLDEQAATAPASPYAASKLAADDLAAGYRRAFGLRQTIVRPFNVYGPWQRGDLEGGVVARFLQSALAERTLEVHGDGAQTRDFLCSWTTPPAALWTQSAETAVGCTLNLATGRETSIRELAALIDDGAGRVRQVPHPHPQAEVERYCGNAARVGELLDWRPRVALAEGLARTRAWFAELAER